MRRLAFAAASLAAASTIVWACGSDSTTPNDAGTPEAGVDAGPDTHVADTNQPDPDSSVRRCFLNPGVDPVALCTQKSLLNAQLKSAFAAGIGTYASWDSNTLLPDKNDAGVPTHDLNDDVAFGAAIASYQVSAVEYGDSEVRGLFDDILVKLEAIIEAEVATPPVGYSGDFYRNLRLIGGGLRLGPAPGLGDRLDVIAEAYGKAILNFAQPLNNGGAGGDAGSDAGGDAGSDAGGDAGGDGGSVVPSDMVLGVQVGGGQVAYVTADVVTGAFALLDMAKRHATDDPAFATKAQDTAVRVIDHVWRRAREPVTGMFYASLVTSTDPTNDALATSTSPNDALYLEVQATVALTLARAQEMVSAPGSTFDALAKTYPFDAHASAVIDACNSPTASLWDGPENPDAGTGGGYFEGYIPSTGVTLTNKPTRGNARMLATYHRILRDIGGTHPWQQPFIRAIVLQATPANSSLFSVVPFQNAYLRAASRSFMLANVFAPDGGVVGPEPRASSYTAPAVEAVCEGLNEFWYRYGQ